MRRSGLIYAFAAACVMAACSVVGKPASKTVAATDPVAEILTLVGAADTLKAPFLYLEGLKSGQIYGDTASAMRFFNAAIAADSTYAPAWYQAAGTLVQSDPGRALRYSIGANRLDSTNQWYNTQLGRLYVLNNEVEKARVLYEGLVAKYPKNPDNYSMLALIYQVNRQPYRAIMLLDSAESKLGRTGAVSAYKLELLMDVKLYERAVAEGQALIRDYPYDYQNYLMMAEIYSQTGKDSLALANFEIARTLNPTGIEILAGLNDFYKRKNDIPNFFATAKELFLSDQLTRDLKMTFYEDLISSLSFYRENFSRIEELGTIFLMKYPADPDIMQLYTRNMIASGNMEGALGFYKRNINDTLPDIKVFNMILEMEAYLNRSDSVAKYAAMAQSFFPETPEFYIQHGSALSGLMQKRKEAIASYEKALKYSRTDSLRSVVYGLMGDTYQGAGEAGKSFDSYEKALKLWPDNAVALNNYSFYLSEQDKHLEKALEMSAKVLELIPGNATYIDTYGWILYKLGRYEEAKKYLQQAISLDPGGSDEIFLHYGDVLHALGEDYMAAIYWKKAAEAGYDKEKIGHRLNKITN